MEVAFDDINPDLRHISLSGRLDILGTDTIAAQFTELSTAEKRNVIVDFTKVTFLASIGIRALISNAKILHKKGGKMALVVVPDTSVAKTLDATGIDMLLKIYPSVAEAESALAG